MIFSFSVFTCIFHFACFFLDLTLKLKQGSLLNCHVNLAHNYLNFIPVLCTALPLQMVAFNIFLLAKADYLDFYKVSFKHL